jgi:hypothetical protein
MRSTVCGKAAWERADCEKKICSNPIHLRIPVDVIARNNSEIGSIKRDPDFRKLKC